MYVSHDWESRLLQAYVLRDLIEWLGFVFRLETRTVQDLPHGRTLQVQWPNGGNAVLHLDQGLGSTP